MIWGLLRKLKRRFIFSETKSRQFNTKFTGTRRCACLLYTSHKPYQHIGRYQNFVEQGWRRLRLQTLLQACIGSVSYTHLDVYKRQTIPSVMCPMKIQKNPLMNWKRQKRIWRSLTVRAWNCRRWNILKRQEDACFLCSPQCQRALRIVYVSVLFGTTPESVNDVAVVSLKRFQPPDTGL